MPLKCLQYKIIPIIIITGRNMHNWFETHPAHNDLLGAVKIYIKPFGENVKMNKKLK